MSDERVVSDEEDAACHFVPEAVLLRVNFRRHAGDLGDVLHVNVTQGRRVLHAQHEGRVDRQVLGDKVTGLDKDCGRETYASMMEVLEVVFVQDKPPRLPVLVYLPELR